MEFVDHYCINLIFIFHKFAVHTRYDIYVFSITYYIKVHTVQCSLWYDILAYETDVDKKLHNFRHNSPMSHIFDTCHKLSHSNCQMKQS